MAYWIKCAFIVVRRGPGQNRVTWKTPSRRAFVPLQEPVAVLASCKCRYEAIWVWSYTTFISCRSRSWDKQAVETIVVCIGRDTINEQHGIGTVHSLYVHLLILYRWMIAERQFLWWGVLVIAGLILTTWITTCYSRCRHCKWKTGENPI